MPVSAPDPHQNCIIPRTGGIHRRQDTPENLQDDPQSLVLPRCRARQDSCKIVPRNLEMQMEQAFCFGVLFSRFGAFA
jgi:hypothetical protein